MFEVAKTAGQPQIKKPVTYAPEGPTLRVVKGLQNANVGDHLEIEKPSLLKVDSTLQKVEEITSENAKVSGEVEIIHHPVSFGTGGAICNTGRFPQGDSELRDTRPAFGLARVNHLLLMSDY